jgi:transposase InsO family protein
MSNDNDAIKVNHIFIWGGAASENLAEARKAEEADLKLDTPKAVLDCLAQCLAHPTYFREAREDFYNARQKPGENTTTFYSRLLELYTMAEFPADSQFLVADKLIHGCLNSDSKRKLMAKGKDVTVKQCLEQLRQNEAVDGTMKRFENQVNFVSHKKPTFSKKNGAPHKRNSHASKSEKQKTEKERCKWCSGHPHPRKECPAKDTKCGSCHKKGHFEKSCRGTKQKKHKSQNLIGVSDSDSEDESGYSYDMDAVSVKGKAREILASVTFHTLNPKKLHGKVDTGAMATCMPLQLLQEIGLSKKNIKPSNARLRGVTGADMRTHGILDVSCTCNHITHDFQIHITELGSELILGLDFCREFNLVKIADSCVQRNINIDFKAVHATDESAVDYSELKKKWAKHLPLGRKTGDPMEDLKAIFPETFDGSVGLFQGEVDLQVSPEAKPIQLPPRAVPLSVLPKLKEELDKMEKEGIIRPCPETTDWVHNLVIVSKKNGDIRVCLDPRNLNKHLIRSRHYTASWEDAQHTFRNGQYFSTLDAKSGYWTKKLNTESQLLTAFNTPFKKYCFVRMPFGLSVSSEIFCEQMDGALAGIPGTFPCADDVKVQGSTEERHDINLLETVQKAKSAGIKFNPAKCDIKKRKISYFGRIVTPTGINPCPKKVDAILALNPPENKQELQSFLGTVNFMSNYIPNLSQKTHMMRGLLRKDVRFCWSSDMQKEFENIKQVIANSVQLTHFNPNKPAIIETDASQKGLGSVLIQEGSPVKFLSKSLTTAEADYSNIERELLAVVFACEKLHTYVFGRSVTVHTDHKPLESIFQKPISLAPPRLQRMLIRLRMYDLHVKYVGAKSVMLADTLSRLVKPGSDKAIPDLDVTIAQIMKIQPTRLEMLQAETKSDSSMSQLADFILNGWPERMHDLPEVLQAYWCFRDELAIMDGLIMKGSRIVVPSTMRPDTLTRLHDGHQGLTSTLQRARRTVYWPGLHNDVSATLSKCTECQQHANKKPRPPERQISVTRPMEVIGIDLMEFKGQHAVVTIDYFSGFITVNYINTQTSAAVIKVLNSDYRKFGLPEKIITDNGPCFKSAKFDKFCADLEIGHITSSPHYHQSNGRVERAIQTIKQILKKTITEQEITLAVIAYHDTPISADLPSPAELFFSRRINTRLGLMYHPSILNDDQKCKLAEKRAAHLTPKDHPPVEYVPRQLVWFTEDTSPDWKPGYIEMNDQMPESYWIISDENGRRIRRNRHDIKPRIVEMTSSTHRPTIEPRIVAEPPSPAMLTGGTPTHLFGEPNTDSPPCSNTANTPATVVNQRESQPKTPKAERSSANSPRKSRAGRCLKENKDPNFVYAMQLQCVQEQVLRT